MTDPETIRAEILNLFQGYERGDLTKRKFENIFTERTVKLCAAVVRRELAEGESIRAEHHFVHAHLSLSQSVLKEPVQVAVSQFVTEQRLFQLCLRILPGRPVTCDERDETELTQISLSSIQGLRQRREIRGSEILAGAMIALVALALLSWMQVTGVFLVGLGIAGMIHGLALPTRWFEIVTEPAAAQGELRIYAVRKKSGRRLVRLLRERIPLPT